MEKGTRDGGRKRGRDKVRGTGRRDRKSLTGRSNKKKHIRHIRLLVSIEKSPSPQKRVLRTGMAMQRADRPESHGLPRSQHTPCIGDTYRAREAVAAVNRRRCPRDPIAPERSKQESESWGEAAQEPPPRCSSCRHSPPRQAWMKNIFGLFCKLGQLALSKSRNTSCSWWQGRREKGG